MNTELLLFLLFILFFFALMAFMILRARREKARQRQRAEALGFTWKEPPDPRLVERASALYPLRPGVKMTARGAAELRGSDYDLYMLDMQSTSANDSAQSGENALVVSSRYLRMPRFLLMSRIEGMGFMVNAANEMLARVMAMAGGVQVAFPENPEFDQSFWVSGDDETAVRRFFNADLQRHLAELQKVQIMAKDDLLIIMPQAPLRYQNEEAHLEALRAWVADVRRVAGWLIDASH